MQLASHVSHTLIQPQQLLLQNTTLGSSSRCRCICMLVGTGAGSCAAGCIDLQLLHGAAELLQLLLQRQHLACQLCTHLLLYANTQLSHSSAALVWCACSTSSRSRRHPFHLLYLQLRNL